MFFLHFHSDAFDYSDMLDEIHFARHAARANSEQCMFDRGKIIKENTGRNDSLIENVIPLRGA